MAEDIQFLPSDWTQENSLIKVVGVGGAGVNAVTYMFNQGITGCHFIVCNTDAQTLVKSTVPQKIQLGAEGLGAGTDPLAGCKAAEETSAILKQAIVDTGTQMLFITAGMGGGTGTGAAPVIAKMAKEAGILTVAVVTIPFRHEGNVALAKAADGIHNLKFHVDSMLIIDNEKLYPEFGDHLIYEAFPKTDEILATAVKGIIEIISKPGYINVDFKDVKTMMKNSGMALMGHGTGNGKTRIEDAVKGAFESPLLSSFDLKTSKNLLINITCGKNKKALIMGDVQKINNMVRDYVGTVEKCKYGIVWDEDPEYDDTLNITAIATGFKVDLTSITGIEILGNLLVVPEDFEYNPRKSYGIGEEVDLGEDNATIEVVGRNSTFNKRKFHFGERKPVLSVEFGEDISELVSDPAKSRISGKESSSKDF